MNAKESSHVKHVLINSYVHTKYGNGEMNNDWLKIHEMTGYINYIQFFKYVYKIKFFLFQNYNDKKMV